MALMSRGDRFTPEQKARDFAYYEAITVRDSSLSACVQAVVAAEVGHLELAYDYFGEAALMDLADLEHNTRDGLHMASLAARGSRRGRVRRDARLARGPDVPSPAARGAGAAAVPADVAGPAAARRGAETRSRTSCSTASRSTSSTATSA